MRLEMGFNYGSKIVVGVVTINLHPGMKPTITNYFLVENIVGVMDYASGWQTYNPVSI